MPDRLSSNRYGNMLDCCPRERTETLNGAKDNPFASAFFLLFSLLEPRFILQSGVCWLQEKKRFNSGSRLAVYFHVVLVGESIRSDSTWEFSRRITLFFLQDKSICLHNDVLWKEHLFYWENNTCIQNKRFTGHEKNKVTELKWLKNPSLSQKGYLFLTWVQSLFVIYVTAFYWPHWPPLILSSPFCFSCVLPQPIHLTIILIFLFSSFHSWPSLHHILLSCLSSLEWCCRRMCFVRRWQETEDSDVLLVLLFALREQEKLHWGFWHLKGVQSSDGMTRGECVGEEKGREGICISNSGGGLAFLDAGKSLTSHVCRDLAKYALKYFKHVNTYMYSKCSSHGK